MKSKLLSTAVKKLVCQQEDLFYVDLGKFNPYSKKGVNCNGAMYPRVPHKGKTKCLKCQVNPGVYHGPKRTKERCPHCNCSLLACLARTILANQASNP